MTKATENPSVNIGSFMMTRKAADDTLLFASCGKDVNEMMAVARALNSEARRRGDKVIKVTKKDQNEYLKWAYVDPATDEMRSSLLVTIDKGKPAMKIAAEC